MVVDPHVIGHSDAAVSLLQSTRWQCGGSPVDVNVKVEAHLHGHSDSELGLLQSTNEQCGGSHVDVETVVFDVVEKVCGDVVVGVVPVLVGVAHEQGHFSRASFLSQTTPNEHHFGSHSLVNVVVCADVVVTTHVHGHSMVLLPKSQWIMSQ